MPVTALVSGMKACCSFLALTLFGIQALATDVGLFDISDTSHPKPLQNQIGEVRIVSQSNSNSHYYLYIRAARSFPVPSKRILLVVGEQKIRFDSEGSDSAGVVSIGTMITDATIIPQIAKQFHATVLNRRHPGHQMLVEFIPAKAAFTVGEPTMVRLRITNVGQHDFAFVEGGRQRGARDNQFAFSAQQAGKIVPDSGNPVHFGGLGVTVKLKASESHEINVDLSKWFKFEPNSSYRVTGSYYMGFVHPEGTSFDTIWEDYACGEFTIETKR